MAEAASHGLIRTRSAEERRRAAAARHQTARAEAECHALSAELSAVQREAMALRQGDCMAPTTFAFRESRLIRAIYTRDTIRVYQAYNDRIADAAVAANSFRAPLKTGEWSAARMTWIKPSAVWMAYRCGWTTKKDRNQARVLALDLCTDRFRDLLRTASVVTKGMKERGCQVIVQWDPERVMDPSAEPKQVFTRPTSDVRSIQIGLRGAAVAMLLDPTFVTQITDVTSRFQEAGAALEVGDEIQAALALWGEHQEQVWPVGPELQATLQMNGTDTADVPPDGDGDCSTSISVVSAAALQEAKRANRMEQHKLNQRAAVERKRESVRRARETERRAQAEEAKVDLDFSGFGDDDY